MIIDKLTWQDMLSNKEGPKHSFATRSNFLIPIASCCLRPVMFQPLTAWPRPNNRNQSLEFVIWFIISGKMKKMFLKLNG